MPIVNANVPAPRVVVVDADRVVTVADGSGNTETVTADTRVVVASTVGAQGPAGSSGDAPTVSYVSDHPGTLYKGAPVALVSGYARRATSVAPYHKIIGLVFDASITQGMAGRIQTDGMITNTALAWDTVTGMVGGLSPGSTYFLSSSGYITPFAPTQEGEYLVPVGIALDSTTLRIELNTSILL